MHEWLLQLGRDTRQHDPQDRLGHPIIAALLQGNVQPMAPAMASLSDTLESLP
jgi:hypothetical protein